MALNSMLCLTSQTLRPGRFREASITPTFPFAVSTVLFMRRRGLSLELNSGAFALTARSVNGNAFARTDGIEEKLVRLLEEEIKQTREGESNWVSGVPVHIPFDAIEDNDGERTVTLTRKYKQESIKLQARIPEDDDVDDDDDDDDEEEEEEEEEDEGDDDEADGHGDEDEDYEDNSIPMVVSISKGNGAVLEFNITTLQDEIIIDSLSLKQQDKSKDEFTDYEPDFSDLDEDMQKTFYKYLDVRGVNLSTVQFLHAYIDDKMSREYLTWLKNLKDFVEK